MTHPPQHKVRSDQLGVPHGEGVGDGDVECLLGRLADGLEGADRQDGAQVLAGVGARAVRAGEDAEHHRDFLHGAVVLCRVVLVKSVLSVRSGAPDLCLDRHGGRGVAVDDGAWSWGLDGYLLRGCDMEAREGEEGGEQLHVRTGR